MIVKTPTIAVLAFALGAGGGAAGTYKYLTRSLKAGTESARAKIAVARDAAGRLWAGTSSGLCRLDEASGAFARYRRNPDDPDSLPADTIRALFLDSSGRFWIGTAAGGVRLYDPATDSFTLPLEGYGVRLIRLK